MNKLNVFKEINELKTQLSYSKNIGFFFGAGTSKALGIPDISELTSGVEAELKGDLLKNYNIIKADLATRIAGRVVNIEDILNQIRRIREITGEKNDKKYLDVDGVSAKALDSEVCKVIYKTLTEKETTVDIKTTKKFFAWLSMQNRDYLKEIYTSNYDLIFERSLEEIQEPYFDGFVGAYEPFFLSSNVDKFVVNEDITKTWVRLWKLHGSLSWFWKKDSTKDIYRIIRAGRINDISSVSNEIVIYPSKEKYDASRKQPFISYFDRLKTYLNRGELLFMISGYSFSDQHINELIINGLRQNSRLHVIVFSYSDSTIDTLFGLTSALFNLSAFGPKKGIINGELCEWSYDKTDFKATETSDSYWEDSKKELKIGDFKKLVEFIIQNSGKKDNIEKVANDR